MTAASAIEFPFRPWVRSTCRKGVVWGIGVIALFGGIAWIFRDPSGPTVGRAFGVLALYALLFLATLLKIWGTAARCPAVRFVGAELEYQPLHTFRPRRIDLDSVHMVAPRTGTQSLRIVHELPRGPQEFYLNLGVVDGRNEFLDELGERLTQRGLEETPGQRNAWHRPDWDEVFVGLQT